MTRFTKVMMGATALSMMAGVAFAQSNEARSTQDGRANDTTILQQSSGRGHDAVSDVTGNRNDVLIDQSSGAVNNSGQATVVIDANPGSRSADNNIEITQEAFQNTTSGFGQRATVDVRGDRNDVVTLQQYGTANIEPNVLTIAVNGNGQGSDNSIDILQSGNGLTSTTTIWGDDNEVDVDQGAGGHTSTIYIDGTIGDDEGDGNSVNVVQRVNGQYIGGNQANVTIYGDDNNSARRFSGVARDLALTLDPGDVIQTGNLNVATLRIGAAGGLDASNNSFAVSQTGLSNDLVADVLGEDNELVVVQSGSDNFSYSLQDGTGNVAAVSQMGSANVSTTMQYGSFNSVSVTQGN
jgi:hypothetical protein